MRTFDAVVVGAGPSGMSAAIGLRAHGLSVLVVDEQPAPGGQIWRAVEAVATTPTGTLLGEEYRAGGDLVSKFRACGASYEPKTQVWQIESGYQIFMSCEGQAESVRTSHVILTMGAQERPAPFPGWTLPGVMTVGAAQILMKTSGQIPTEPVWVVGSGPLPLLYMAQLVRAGGKIAGWLDTAPPGGWRRALPFTGVALAGYGDIFKGLAWLREIRASGAKRVRGVTNVRAHGQKRLQEIEYTQANGKTARAPAGLLLVHEGVVPSIHMTQALGCQHEWNSQQACLAPVLDKWGQTDKPGLYVAGDGAGIGGAYAACVRGELVALGVAERAGRLSPTVAAAQAVPLRTKLKGLMRLRPMLDAMYPPRADIASPTDDTIVCRCEELTAGDIRKAAAIGQPGMNNLKAYVRAGMGACQGRQCGYTVAHIIAQQQNRDVAEVGFYRIRPPLKPITLAELATLNIDAEKA